MIANKPQLAYRAIDIFQISVVMLQFLSSVNFWEFLERKHNKNNNKDKFITKMQHIYFDKVNAFTDFEN